MVLAGHTRICRMGRDVDLGWYRGAAISPPRGALAGAGLIGKPGMAGAIGDPFHRLVAAKAEVFFAGAADRPAAPFLAQFKQGAVLFAVNGLVAFSGRGLRKQFPQYAVLQPRHGFLTASPALVPSRLKSFFPRQVEAGELADHGVAAHPDFIRDLAAGKPGREMDFEEFDALCSPGVVGHLKVPKHEPSLRLPHRPHSRQSVPNARVTESFRCPGSKAGRP